MGCRLHQDGRSDYIYQALEGTDQSPQQEFQPRFRFPGQTLVQIHFLCVTVEMNRRRQSSPLIELLHHQEERPSGGSRAPPRELSESDYERVVFLSSLIGADAGLQFLGPQRRAEPSWLELERPFFL